MDVSILSYRSRMHRASSQPEIRVYGVLNNILKEERLEDNEGGILFGMEIEKEDWSSDGAGLYKNEDQSEKIHLEDNGSQSASSCELSPMVVKKQIQKSVMTRSKKVLIQNLS